MNDKYNPFKDFTPKQNPANSSLGANTRVSFIPDMDNAGLRKLAREKLSMALQTISPEDQPEMTRKLCAELMDRLDGKPAQSVNIDATVRQITVNATIRFADQPVVIEHESTGGNSMQAIDNNE